MHECRPEAHVVAAVHLLYPLPCTDTLSPLPGLAYSPYMIYIYSIYIQYIYTVYIYAGPAAIAAANLLMVS
jgi:hypothetical protein